MYNLVFLENSYNWACNILIYNREISSMFYNIIKQIIHMNKNNNNPSEQNNTILYLFKIINTNVGINYMKEDVYFAISCKNKLQDIINKLGLSNTTEYKELRNILLNIEIELYLFFKNVPNYSDEKDNFKYMYIVK